MPLAAHHLHLVRRAAVAVVVLTATGAVLAGRTDMTSDDFAKAACADFSELLEVDSPTRSEVIEAVARAAARADRAATVDASFDTLDTDFAQIHDAVRQTADLTDDEGAAADASIAAVANRCAELAAPGTDAGSRLATLTIADLRQP